jgi:single-strand selective monofunctional uracil DNA glycosylase
VGGTVRAPPRPHPRRPVLGFACQRREPSGTRLYGWARDRYGTAERFFGAFFVANYCPLLFFDEDGRNLTPPQLAAPDRRAVQEACDEHLADVLAELRCPLAVGVGAFAAEQARRVVEARGLDAKVGTILHPSPASPAANRGWAQQAERQLAALGVGLPAHPPASA